MRRMTLGSAPVVLNQPPFSASQNCSSCRFCSVRAHSSQCGVAARLKQLDEAEDEIRVVFRVPVDRRIPVAIAPLHDLPAGIPHVLFEELRRTLSRAQITGPRIRAGNTRAALANAASISPFQPVSTLSSRCGRGRESRA